MNAKVTGVLPSQSLVVVILVWFPLPSHEGRSAAARSSCWDAGKRTLCTGV